MKVWTRIAFVMLFIPLVAQAQFRDLDAAMSNLERGFGGGDVDAIVSGISASSRDWPTRTGSSDAIRLRICSTASSTRSSQTASNA